MRNFIKMIGLITLIVFSFFYTDKVIEVIREEDDIMVELQSVKDIYKVEPIDANIVSNTIIPGLNGRSINIEQSYKKMKYNGIFEKNLLIYDTISPDISIRTNKDKFIIRGHNNKQMVSLLFILNNDKYLNYIEKILSSKGVFVNYFISYKYLIDNSTKIKEMTGHEFYSYGDDGKYTPDNLLFSNNLISRISNNNAVYCLAQDMQTEILELCSKNDLYTITPTIIGGEKAYNAIKENLDSGSIILLTMNSETVKELTTIIDYIKGKGLKISPLSLLLSEELQIDE